MSYFTDPPRLPVIDLAPFEIGNPWRDSVAAQLDWAAAEFGIFRVINHGIDPAVSDTLLTLTRSYFGRRMTCERRARSPAGPGSDAAEELYFDEAFARDDLGALAALCAGDRDVFFELPGLRDVVRDYIAGVKGLAHRLVTSFARGLHLGDPYFFDRYAGDAGLRVVTGFEALTSANGRPALLTILGYDERAQLEVSDGRRMIDVPPVPGALVCAVGESLEVLTEGRYRSAFFRLVSPGGQAAVAAPFYFGTGTGIGVGAQVARELRTDQAAHAETARAA